MRSQEHYEQTAVIEWKNWNLKKYPELSCLFAIPNGGKRHAITALKLKQEGVMAGVPDLCLPVARGGYNALFIEMKVKPNKPTTSQLEWHKRLKNYRNKVEVCYSADEAISVIKQYLF